MFFPLFCVESIDEDKVNEPLVEPVIKTLYGGVIGSLFPEMRASTAADGGETARFWRETTRVARPKRSASKRPP